MAIYTVGRRRVIIVLLLTSALILTLDLRGNAVIDRTRDGFSVAMQPVENATEVVAGPVRRFWNSFANYDDLERENEILRERNDRLIGTQAAAEASVVDYQQLLALSNLPSLSGIDQVRAEVVGASANNLDQIVEINKGSLDGIVIGMPVVNQAGLVGRITKVFPQSSTVMLVTDSRFRVAVQVLGGTGETGALGAETVTTSPSGLTPDELAAAGADEPSTTDADTVADGTTVLDVLGDQFPLPDSAATTVPEADPNVVTVTTDPEGNGLPPAIPADGSPVQTTAAPTDTTTTTTVPPQLEKEFGVMEGRGQGPLPRIRFIQDNPSLAILQEGDLVATAGPSESLSPPNIPVGRVKNRANRPGVAGPTLEIELNADLGKLAFVNVVLFRPASEVEQ